MRAITSYISNRKTLSTQNKKKLKSSGILMSIVPLAACGGSKDGPVKSVSAIPDASTNFDETATNTFTAVDNSNSTIVFLDTSEDLNLTGLGGDDTISSGSGDDTIVGGDGNDMIRAGKGADDISGGGGDDVIVLIGTTTAGQYDASDITSPTGSGVDLSPVLSLESLNGQTTSEVSAGETIDGGAGNNTIYVYGTVDLTGVTLTNVEVIYISSEVTLTPDQLAGFTTINGDGSSIINIVVPEGGEYIIDLTAIDISGIAEIHVDGNVTFIVENMADLAGIANISAEPGSIINLEITDQDQLHDLTLEEIWTIFDQVVVKEFNDDSYSDYIIYTDRGNFEEDAGSGLISSILQSKVNSPFLYLVGDQTGQNVFNVDLSSYDLTGLRNIFLSENGLEKITLTKQNIIDWEARDFFSPRITVFGSDNDVMNTDFDTTVDAINDSFVNAISFGYSYSDDGEVLLSVSPGIALASGFAIPGGYTETSTNVYDADAGADQTTLWLENETDGVTVNSADGSLNVIRTGSGDDVITGTTGRMLVNSGAGHDIIVGGDGNDSLRGNEGNDAIFGGAGRDNIYGGAGADNLDGGDGLEDQVNYYLSDAAVMVDLSTNTVSGGFAEGDIIVNFERVYGSAYDDTIKGDGNDNQLSGGEGGYDVLHGGGGNDSFSLFEGEVYGDAGDDSFFFRDERYLDISFDGGEGQDTVIFWSDDELNIDLSTFDASNLEAIQIIASNDDRSENLNFTVQDVINLTDEDNILRILGGDDADLVTSSGEGWVQGGTTVINSPLYGRDGLFDITFDIYTHGSGATLLVDTFTPTDIS